MLKNKSEKFSLGLLDEILQGKRLEKYIPVIGWITTYHRAWLRDDVISGVVVGLIMIPVAMAYAQMAGVPPQAGLYSAILGMTVCAVFATSRHLKITTSSTMAIMSIVVVAPLAGDPNQAVAEAALYALGQIGGADALAAIRRRRCRPASSDTATTPSCCVPNGWPTMGKRLEKYIPVLRAHVQAGIAINVSR